MAKLLVVSFIPFPHVSGMAVQLKHVLHSLASKFSVDLLVVRRGKEPYVAKYGRVRILRVPVGDESIEKQKESFSRALNRQMEGADYAAVHCMDEWLTPQLKTLSEQHRFAVVFDLSRALCGKGEFRRGMEQESLRKKLKAASEKADLVLAPHVLVLEKLDLNISKDKTFLCSLGVDINHFDWEDRIPKNSTKNILVVDTIDEKSGSRHLLKLLHRLNEHDDVSLLWAGPVARQMQPKIEQAIVECGLESKVKIVGKIGHDHLPTLIAQSDVCLVPRISFALEEWGAFPSTILEYMACKRPVVAPRALQFTSFGLTENEIFMFDPENWNDCLTTCQEALGSENASEERADKAYQWVRSDHSASNIRRRLFRAYGWLAQSNEWANRFVDHLEEENVPRPGTYSGVKDIEHHDGSISTITGLIPPKEDSGLMHMDDVTNIDVNPMKHIHKEDEQTEPTDLPQVSAMVSGEVEFKGEQTVKIKFDGPSVQVFEPETEASIKQKRNELPRSKKQTIKLEESVEVDILERVENEFTIEDD